jgi:acetyl esterase
MHLKGKR